MKTNRNTARMMGVLYILGTVAGILSLVFTAPIRDAQDLLAAVSAHENQIVLGTLFVLIMGLALAMIPVVAFPVLRKQNEALALGYVVFRAGLEAAVYMAVVVSWLLLLPLSQIYGQADASIAPAFQALGNLLLEAEELSYVLTTVFCLGALLFYTVLYQSRLIPRWLSGFGLITVPLFLAAGAVLPMFGLLKPMSPIYVVLELPLALHEMGLAVWLIVRGFNPSAIHTAASAQIELKEASLNTSR